MLFRTAFIKSLISALIQPNFYLHLIRPKSQKPMTLFNSSLSYLGETPALERGERWETTHAAIFNSFKQEFCRQLSYVAVLANEVRVEHTLERLDGALVPGELPRGVVLKRSEREYVINSLAVHPESRLSLSLKRRIAKALEDNDHTNPLSSLIEDREYWAGVVDECFMAAHSSDDDCIFLVDNSLIPLFPRWISEQLGGPGEVRCVSLTLHFPLAIDEYARGWRECESSLSTLLSICESSLLQPSLRFYREVTPHLTEIQNRYKTTGPGVVLTLMLLSDIKKHKVRIPIAGFELRENRSYRLQLTDGTEIYMRVPPWKLGQTFPARDDDDDDYRIEVRFEEQR